VPKKLTDLRPFPDNADLKAATVKWRQLAAELEARHSERQMRRIARALKGAVGRMLPQGARTNASSRRGRT